MGKLFSVNEMVRKESVRARLEEREQSLSFTEFSYMLLQAWDFLQLYDRYHCELQLGGSDQWGNITEGIDLIRRQRGAPAFGLTSPLVTKADGSKFGKTESRQRVAGPGPDQPVRLLPVLAAHRRRRSRCLLAALHLPGPRARSRRSTSRPQPRPERRQAQRALAFEVTAMVHGETEARRAEEAAAVLFTPGIASLDPATLKGALADAPTTPVTRRELLGGLTVVEALLRSGLATSRRQARQLLSDGGVYLNGHRVAEDRSLDAGDVLHDRWVVLRRGRAHQAVLVMDRTERVGG